jgi:thymidine kinase
VGRIEVITGPMFSGKSEELIRRLKRARIARQRVACFKPDIDLRYHRTSIASHSAQTHEAMTVANVARLREAIYGQLPEIEVIGIDEAQFFDEAIVHLVGELVHMGKRILIAGLDTTFTGDPFGPIPALMAISDEVTKLSAVCIVCGAPAIHTQRLGASRELVVVGAAGVYEARCRACFRPIPERAGERADGAARRGAGARRAVAARARYFSPLRVLICIERAGGIAMRLMRPVLAVSVSAFCLIAFTHYADSVHAQNQRPMRRTSIPWLFPSRHRAGRTPGARRSRRARTASSSPSR